MNTVTSWVLLLKFVPCLAENVRRLRYEFKSHDAFHVANHQFHGIVPGGSAADQARRDVSAGLCLYSPNGYPRSECYESKKQGTRLSSIKMPAVTSGLFSLSGNTSESVQLALHALHLSLE